MSNEEFIQNNFGGRSKHQLFTVKDKIKLNKQPGQKRLFIVTHLIAYFFKSML